MDKTVDCNIPEFSFNEMCQPTYKKTEEGPETAKVTRDSKIVLIVLGFLIIMSLIIYVILLLRKVLNESKT